ncbi:hypothetical protein IWW50_004459, partial [Coemansia erecta]
MLAKAARQVSSTAPRLSARRMNTTAAAAAAAKQGSGSYRQFGRTVAKWVVGSTVLAGVGYYVGRDEIEAFDNEEPASELRLAAGREFRGLPVVETESQGRERLVVLGSGWGAVAVLKT